MRAVGEHIHVKLLETAEKLGAEGIILAAPTEKRQHDKVGYKAVIESIGPLAFFAEQGGNREHPEVGDHVVLIKHCGSTYWKRSTGHQRYKTVKERDILGWIGADEVDEIITHENEVA
jgi:hypothetical protein